MHSPSLVPISAVVFLTVLLAALTAYLYIRSRPGRLQRRLDEIRDGVSVGDSGDEAGLAPTVPMSGPPPGSAQAALTRAGYRHPRALLTYRTTQAVLAVTFALTLLGATSRMELKPQVLVLSFGAAVMAGIVVPHVWLGAAATRRRQQVRAAVPNALDLIIVCVEAGLGLNPAIQRVATEMRTTYPELSLELALLDQEIFLGQSRAAAFHNMAQRTGVDELRSLATVLMQSDRLGTSIAHVLRVQAATIREKRRQMVQELSRKMPIKLVFPLILFIFPELLVVLLGPAAITVLRALSSAAG